MAKQKFDYDFISIGSGAAGSVAADIVARQGKRVALIESSQLGGECPHTGCVPIKSLLHAARIYDDARHAQRFGIRSAAIGYNFPSVKAWKDLAIQRTGALDGEKYYSSRGIKVYKGSAHFISPNEITVNRRHLSAEKFLVATGSHWVIPSETEGLDKVPFLTAREALGLTKPPKSLFIIGAGSTGCEFAQLFSIFGTKVYLADIAPRILPGEDTETSELIESVFARDRGMQILTKTKVLRVSREGMTTRVTYLRGGQQHSAKVDQLMIACGKQPNVDIGLENAGVEYSTHGIEVDANLQTSARHIFAAGDVIGRYMQTHTAVYEGRIVAHNLTSRNRLSPMYHAVPRIMFLSPEVASVGLSEADCLKRDLTVRTAIAPLNIIARSNISDYRDGFCKIITDKKGVLIGATVVAPGASEIIHELTLAIHHGMTASDITSTLHAFPSWNEVVRVACSKISA